MRKAVFSIVAKNYIPMANALGDSVKRQHPDLPFFIVVADPEDGLIRFDEQRYPIIPAAQLGIGKLAEMAFKYNVTEFCTALKPFSFQYLFGQGFDQVIYFDPDIFVFNSLDAMFGRLNDASLIVTPHVCTLQNHYTGLVPEAMLLGVGIFNFGFCALSNSQNGRRIADWWAIRLTDQCYGDKIDCLHTDQKWMDFMPSLIDDVYIERGLGYNVAIWNWHERRVQERDGQFWVINRIDGTGRMPLVFYHFSNYHFREAANPDRFRPKYVQRFTDLFPVGDFYARQLANEQMGEYSRLYTYSYNVFSDGSPIVQFQRRLYRRLVESGYSFADPFAANAPASFHALLKKNGLLGKPTPQTQGLDKQNEMTFPGFESKLIWLQRAARLARRVLGFERYALLCKFMQRFVRPENQTFLFDEVGGKIPFYNENRYINWAVEPDATDVLWKTASPPTVGKTA